MTQTFTPQRLRRMALSLGAWRVLAILRGTEKRAQRDRVVVDWAADGRHQPFGQGSRPGKQKTKPRHSAEPKKSPPRTHLSRDESSRRRSEAKREAQRERDAAASAAATVRDVFGSKWRGRPSLLSWRSRQKGRRQRCLAPSSRR